MDLINCLGVNLEDEFRKLKSKEPVIEYIKIEEDEFVKLPEKGFYLHSSDGSGIVTGLRVFFEACDGYAPASNELRGKYANIKTFDDLERFLGPCKKEIRVFEIPGTKPTLPGKLYRDNDIKVTGYSADGRNIAYLHIKRFLS